MSWLSYFKHSGRLPLHPIQTLLCLLFFFNLGRIEIKAQSEKGLRYDLELWSSAGLKMKIAKNLTGKIDYAHRFDDTIQTVKSRFFNLAIDYDLLEGVEASVQYRFFLKDADGFSRQRWMPQISFEPKSGRFKYRWRSRVDFDLVESGIWESTWRNQIRIKYEPPKFFIEPSVSYELFHFTGPEISGSYKNRLMCSFDFKIGKHHRLEIEAGAQQEWSVRKPQFDKIFSFSYQVDL